MTAHVNIGSNKGNRRAVIDRAIALVASRLGCADTLRRSEPVETAPWGYDSANHYLNVAVAFDTDLPPERLHEALQRAQRDIDPAPHRDAAGNYIDRTIDIDLIAVGSAVVDTPALTLPHPRMHLRDFVLIPMCALDPDWVHPTLHLSTRQLLANLQAAGEPHLEEIAKI